jgi:hypothetical protein
MGLPIVRPMNASLFRARQISLALLVIAVVEHGHLNGDYSGAHPNASGLLRLGRDLLRQKSRAEAKRPTRATEDLERGAAARHAALRGTTSTVM